MKYVIASTRWLLGQRFAITDDSGAPLFNARSSFGTFGTKLTAYDGSGREIMSVRKGPNSGHRDAYVGDEHVARVTHRGIFTPGYIIVADNETITEEGNFGGGEATLSRFGAQVATTARQRNRVIALNKWSVDIDDYQDQVMLLAIILAMAHHVVSGDRN